MALRVTIGLGSVAKVLQEIKEGIEEDIRDIVLEEMLVGLDMAQQKALAEDKVGAGNPERYADSFRVEEDGRKFSLVNEANHAEVVEFGAKPHKPPLGRLQEWAKAKWGLSDEAAYAVARGVQKKIQTEGLEPTPILQETLDEVASRIRARIRQYRAMHELGTTRTMGRIRTRYGLSGTYGRPTNG